MLQVEIITNSALMLGSGTGRGSFIDSDIVFDEYGLPLFPGRRFKGLLRESAEEVIEMLTKCGSNSFFAEDILEIVFGTSTSMAGIRVNDLYLTDSQNTGYETLVQWLRYIRQECPQLINKDAVINALTHVRQQTAISEEGFAKENSLRTMRVLKSGNKFVGVIEVLREERRAEIEALLALACSNLRKVGSGRNRGWGEIECHLYNNDGTNLNKQVIEKLKDYQNHKTLFFEKNSENKNRNIFDLNLELSGQSTEPAVLKYRITNLAPLLFTSPDGDEKMVCTLSYIPGAALHGYYANRLNREGKLDSNSAHKNKLFRRWFLEGKLRFTNAYPVCKTCNHPLYPTPLFFYTDKQEIRPYNLLEDFEEDKEIREDADKTVGGYCAIIGNELHKHEPEKVINFHLMRNNEANDSNVRIKGNVQEGGIFHYEAIKPGQEFHGYICGDKAELELFRDMFARDNNIRLGRSLNTQYGVARIEFNELEVEPHSIGKAFMLNDDEGYYTVDLNGRILLYLSSPLILINNQGFYTTDERDLIRYLQTKLDITNIKIKKSFARVETRQSFLSHLKIYEPGFRCYLAGSAFLLELCDTDGKLIKIDKDLQSKLNRLMIEGIGEKCHLGYGRVEFYTQFPKVNRYYRLDDISREFAEEVFKPEGSIPALIQEMLKAIYCDNLQRIVVAAAAKRSKEYYSGNKSIRLSSNLLGRLETICRNSKNAKDFAEKIEKLRETAREPLEKMCLCNRRLYDDLIGLKLETICPQYVQSDHVKLLEKMAKFVGIAVTPDYKVFWRVFFQTMRKLQKRERIKEGGGESSV